MAGLIWFSFVGIYYVILNFGQGKLQIPEPIKLTVFDDWNLERELVVLFGRIFRDDLP